MLKESTGIITLSSDEDEKQDKSLLKRKIIDSTNNKSITCLSSDDDFDKVEPVVKKKHKSADKNNKSSVSAENCICLDSDDEKSEKRNVKDPLELSEPKIVLHAIGVDDLQTNNGESFNGDSSDLRDNGNNIKSKEALKIDGESSNFEETKDLLELNEFISACIFTAGPAYKELLSAKSANLRKIYKHFSEDFQSTDHFKNYLIQQTAKAKQCQNAAVIVFQDVYQYAKTILHSNSLDIPLKVHKKLRKMEYAMKKIVKKIKELETTEVNLDEDDENSAYIMEDRYKRRLNLIYNKYCKLLKKNPYSGRLTHTRLDFVSAHYNELNLAINKKYKNCDFPNYSEFSDYIRSVVEEKNIKLTENELKIETEFCFKKLGSLLQTRRKKELYDSHCSFILNGNDPADTDPDLDNTLKKNNKEFVDKTDKLLEEYARKQEMIGEEEQSDSCKENDQSSAESEVSNDEETL